MKNNLSQIPYFVAEFHFLDQNTSILLMTCCIDIFVYIKQMLSLDWRKCYGDFTCFNSIINKDEELVCVTSTAWFNNDTNIGSF